MPLLLRLLTRRWVRRALGLLLARGLGRTLLRRAPKRMLLRLGWRLLRR